MGFTDHLLMINSSQPMNTPEPLEIKVAMSEELKAEFEKLHKQYQYLYIGYLIDSITIILLLLFPFPQ